MHFSRPSGQRLSWWRPWKRGAVGSFSKGYCSVTTFLNMVRKVTPKPATGSTNCSLSERDPVFLSGFWSAIAVPFVADGAGRRVAGAEDERGGRAAHRSAGRHRRDREAAGERRVGPVGGPGGGRLGLLVLAHE